MRKLFIRLSLLVAGLVAVGGLVAPSAAALDLIGGVCQYTDSAGKVHTIKDAAGCKDIKEDKLTGPSGIIHDVTVLVSVVGGIAGVLMVMVGGFMYATSAGEAGKLTNARNTILYALIGLAVIALARTIILFVLNRV